MSQIYTVEEISEKLSPIFSVNSVNKAVIFGSYAKGNPTKLSDVDIMIDSNDKIKGIDFFGVLDEIVDALRMPVDLIEASQVIDGGRVENEIAETGVVIFEGS